MSFRGTVRVGFSVTGLNEALGGIAGIIMDLNQTKMQIHKEAADVFVKQAKTTVHVISGKLKASIKTDSVTPEQAIVSANTPYAGKEEERPGNRRTPPSTPHAYMKPAAAFTATQFPMIIKRNFDMLLNRHKTH